jgi:hypothetical protein
METWNYMNESITDEYLQNAWNYTLISKLNEINKSILNEDCVITASYALKDLLESLVWLNKPTINYRYDNEHSIYVNDIKLRIENYEYNHQKNEEWIESQKNICDLLTMEDINKKISEKNKGNLGSNNRKLFTVDNIKYLTLGDASKKLNLKKQLIWD